MSRRQTVAGVLARSLVDRVPTLPPAVYTPRWAIELEGRLASAEAHIAALKILVDQLVAQHSARARPRKAHR